MDATDDAGGSESDFTFDFELFSDDDGEARYCVRVQIHHETKGVCIDIDTKFIWLGLTLVKKVTYLVICAAREDGCEDLFHDIAVFEVLKDQLCRALHVHAAIDVEPRENIADVLRRHHPINLKLAWG